MQSEVQVRTIIVIVAVYLETYQNTNKQNIREFLLYLKNVISCHILLRSALYLSEVLFVVLRPS